ncbi:MAG: glycoside hydrolase family 43 protein [Lachnospiraceae bacterium]|nr:glycoside hydrolase family 43 protein [Lachnospiraceae bacterium]
MSIYAKNPIMPGFYPDPSICAVGEDYYLINSTFSYFPGLSLMHSKDLVHWEQIGNVMNRNSQLPLMQAGHSQGLFAPTIRYFNGTFYVICTNVSHGGNYIVTATNPEGPWSEPYYLEGADGIDPSLFFDDDGRCYYIGTHPNPDGVKYNGDWYIYIQEVDIKNMKLIGEHKNVWNGAMKGVHWPEGPHIYKKDDYYYIMHAEGGTGPEHAVTICRSKDIWGPYENNFCNPILTHRHLGFDYPIKYVGHADLIETPAGEWFMTMLAVRPIEGFTTMGRETFLAKVTWENGWPVVNPGVGILTDTVEINLPEWKPEEDPNSYTCRTSQKNCVPGSNRTYNFANMKVLGDEFLMLRNPKDDMYRLEQGKGLCLRFDTITLKELESPSFVAIRQQHHKFTVAAELSTRELTAGKLAGLVLLQSNEYHLKAEVSEGMASVILCEANEDIVLGSTNVEGKKVTLKLYVNDLNAAVSVVEGDKETLLAEEIDVRKLSTEVAGGFVGCCIGVYAIAEQTSGDEAVFTTLSYEA